LRKNILIRYWKNTEKNRASLREVGGGGNSFAPGLKNVRKLPRVLWDLNKGTSRLADLEDIVSVLPSQFISQLED